MLNKRFFSSTYQVQRIIIMVAAALAIASFSFGGYYYYDRYYTSQPKTADVMLSGAEQAVRDNPNDPAARLDLAELYMVNGKYDDAIKVASDVMKAYPDNQRTWFIIGVANALGGKPEQAVEPLQKLLDANKDVEMAGLNKSIKSAAYYLGDSYMHLNQPDKAILPLEQAVIWSQTDADAMYKLGMAYLGVQRYVDALNQFNAATRFVPNYTECYEGMASAFDGLKQPDYANYARGMVAYSKKDYETALPLLLKAIEAKKDFLPAYDGLGLTYEALGDLKNAKVYYEIAVKIDSHDFTATTGLQRVESLLNK